MAIQAYDAIGRSHRKGVVPVQLRVWERTGTLAAVWADGPPTIRLKNGVHAPPWMIVDEVQRRFGLEVVILRIAAEDIVEVELCGFTKQPTEEFTWLDCAMFPRIHERAVWQRPGWLVGILPEVDRELAQIGLKRLGPPRQVRHTSVTGMLRIPTDRGFVWLKAAPQLFAHEPLVTRWLMGIARFEVPEVLAISDGWWLAKEFPKPKGFPTSDPLALIAETQIAVSSHVEEIRALGCPDRPLARLPEQVFNIIHRDHVLDGKDRRSLENMLPRLAEKCEELEELGLPLTLVHGDFWQGNIRWTGNNWFVYDWTDSCLTHPFLELALPLTLETDSTVAAIRGREFVRTWSRFFPKRKIEGTVATAAAIGSAHLAITYQWILDNIDRTAADQASGDRLFAFLRFWLTRLNALLCK